MGKANVRAKDPKSGRLQELGEAFADVDRVAPGVAQKSIHLDMQMWEELESASGEVSGWAAIESFTEAERVEAIGWLELRRRLISAALHPDILKTRQARLLAEVVFHATAGPPGLTAEQVLARLDGALQAMRASKKGGEPKEWVRSEYRERGGGYESKPDFARFYVDQVKRKFGVAVSHRHMTERWLKGL
jgi:hypothetical protein